MTRLAALPLVSTSHRRARNEDVQGPGLSLRRVRRDRQLAGHHPLRHVEYEGTDLAGRDPKADEFEDALRIHLPRSTRPDLTQPAGTHKAVDARSARLEQDCGLAERQPRPRAWEGFGGHAANLPGPSVQRKCPERADAHPEDGENRGGPSSAVPIMSA